jgi:hypothetical protein
MFNGLIGFAQAVGVDIVAVLMAHMLIWIGSRFFKKRD